jgi:hypothetical protein
MLVNQEATKAPGAKQAQPQGKEEEAEVARTYLSLGKQMGKRGLKEVVVQEVSKSEHSYVALCMR